MKQSFHCKNLSLVYYRWRSLQQWAWESARLPRETKRRLKMTHAHTRDHWAQESGNRSDFLISLSILTKTATCSRPRFEFSSFWGRKNNEKVVSSMCFDYSRIGALNTDIELKYTDEELNLDWSEVCSVTPYQLRIFDFCCPVNDPGRLTLSNQLLTR